MTRFVLSFFVLMVGWVGASPLTLNCPGGMQDMSGNSAITFGGTGIPKDAVCAGTFGGVDVALVATPRYSNPAVGNDGVASYFASIGNDAANSQPSYAVWNFGFYAKNNSGGDLAIQLLWDTNPGVSTDLSEFGFLTQMLGVGGTSQNSWNLGMGFIDTGVSIPLVYAPAAGLFDPFAAGEYTFGLRVMDLTGQNLGTLAMEVNTTGSDVPEPGTLGLCLFGASLIFASKWRR